MKSYYGTVTTSHFESLYKELLNPAPLWQAFKQETKDRFNHSKEVEPKANVGVGCQGGICRCNEVETEAIPVYICPRNRNCNQP